MSQCEEGWQNLTLKQEPSEEDKDSMLPPVQCCGLMTHFSPVHTFTETMDKTLFFLC